MAVDEAHVFPGFLKPVLTKLFFSYNIFHPLGELSTIFTKFEIVILKLLQFGSLKHKKNLASKGC